MYLLNRDRLNAAGAGPHSNSLSITPIGACYCAESFFVDDAGVPHIVTSGGDALNVWHILDNGKHKLINDASLKGFKTKLDPSFFTSVSSNGTRDTIIWALPHSLSPEDPDIFLQAFDPSQKLKPLLKVKAGEWPFEDNPNLVPVVVNGKVYVGSNEMLTIFGIKH